MISGYNNNMSIILLTIIIPNVHDKSEIDKNFEQSNGTNNQTVFFIFNIFVVDMFTCALKNNIA